MVKLVLFCMYGITKPMGWFQGGTPYSWYSIGGLPLFKIEEKDSPL